MKRLLVLLLPVLLLVLGLPGTASAENAAQVAAALRNGPVYQSPGVDLVDVTALSSQLSGTDPPVKVAVLPAAAAASSTQAAQLATTIVRDLGDRNAVVLVITANRHLGAAAGPDARGRGVVAAT
ncbi:MAG: hypothetical protein JWN55_2176, partial [Frankiales bacterium]|nr:hypothetical protein [Frankiales bacterium]